MSTYKKEVKMLKVVRSAVVLISILVFLVGCGTSSKNGNAGAQADVKFGEDDYQKLTDANNELGYLLIDQVSADQDGNFFISPISLQMALSMVYNGAEGTTKDEIAKVLQLEGIDIEQLNKANASLISKMTKNDEKIMVKLANSIWLNEEYTFQEEFTKDTSNYFNAKVAKINVKNEKSVKDINNWVKQATNGKIDEIVEAPLDTKTIAMLINAIYFKGDWTYSFDEEMTIESDFYLSNGEVKKVPLMATEQTLPYLETDDFQAVSLPYGEGEMKMNIFLPKDHTTLEQFQENMNVESMKKWLGNFKEQEGMLQFPKFTLEYETLLNEPLQRLGMVNAFSEEANFNNMIADDGVFFISEVKQKSFIEVQEEGTEAAAVTSVTVETTAFNPEDETFYMSVNRPFFFTITDEETETVLFMGKIENPSIAK